MKIRIHNTILSIRIFAEEDVALYKQELMNLYGLNSYSDDGTLLMLIEPDRRKYPSYYTRELEIIFRFMHMGGHVGEIPIRKYHNHLIELGEIGNKIKIPTLKKKIRVKFDIRNKYTFKRRIMISFENDELNLSLDKYLKREYKSL